MKKTLSVLCPLWMLMGLCSLLLGRRTLWFCVNSEGSSGGMWVSFLVGWTSLVGRGFFLKPRIGVVCVGQGAESMVRAHAPLFPWVLWRVEKPCVAQPGNVCIEASMLEEASTLSGACLQVLTQLWPSRRRSARRRRSPSHFSFSHWVARIF
jgi:hypothetical protein